MISKLLKKNEKGFTLMEMLIVVAIIAVLVAIAIPTFNSSLNKARVATDQANIRSGYASMMADVLTNKYEADTTAASPTSYTYYLQKDGSVSATAPGTYTCFGHQDSATLEVAGITVGTWEKGATVSYVYTVATGAVTITVTNP